MALTRRHILKGTVYTSLMLPFTGCITISPPPVALPAGSKVLALGDSLTFGTGVEPQDSYPSVLAEITGWDVINAGIPGDISSGVLKRLPWLLKKYKPALVLTCIGINDFMLKKSGDEVKANILKICRMIQNDRTQQILIAVPYITPENAEKRQLLQDATLYEEVAKDLNIPLQEMALLQMVADPSRLSDFIHGNAEGYKNFAYEIAVALHDAGILAKVPVMPS